jgi:hypothetical protein
MKDKVQKVNNRIGNSGKELQAESVSLFTFSLPCTWHFGIGLAFSYLVL